MVTGYLSNKYFEDDEFIKLHHLYTTNELDEYFCRVVEGQGEEVFN